MFYYLIDSATGEKLGETADKIKNGPADMSGKEWVEFNERPKGLWNPATRTHDARPVQKIISKLEFIERLTDSEFENILDVALLNTNPARKVRVFIKKLELAESIDLADQRMIRAVNGMESIGLIGTGRAAEILA